MMWVRGGRGDVSVDGSRAGTPAPVGRYPPLPSSGTTRRSRPSTIGGVPFPLPPLFLAVTSRRRPLGKPPLLPDLTVSPPPPITMTSSDHRPRSRPSRLAVLAAVAVAAAGLATPPTPVAAGDILSYYADGKTTSGDGTYYWTTDWGQCSLVPRPPNARGRQGVALNARQWRELGESAFCGMCVTVDGSGSGRGADPIRGTYDAYVMDHCSSCTGGSWGGYGDLDFSDGGKDGRWDITWRAVPCPVEGPIEYVFVGSHKWYIKVRDVGATRGTACGGGAGDGGGGVAGERRGCCFGGGGKREWVCAATTVRGSTVDSAPFSLLLTCSSSVLFVVLRSRCVGDETLTSPLSPLSTPPLPGNLLPPCLPHHRCNRAICPSPSRRCTSMAGGQSAAGTAFSFSTPAAAWTCRSKSKPSTCGGRYGCHRLPCVCVGGSMGGGGEWKGGGGSRGRGPWAYMCACVCVAVCKGGVWVWGAYVGVGDSIRGDTERRRAADNDRRQRPSTAAAQRLTPLPCPFCPLLGWRPPLSVAACTLLTPLPSLLPPSPPPPALLPTPILPPSPPPLHLHVGCRFPTPLAL